MVHLYLIGIICKEKLNKDEPYQIHLSMLGNNRFGVLFTTLEETESTSVYFSSSSPDGPFTRVVGTGYAMSYDKTTFCGYYHEAVLTVDPTWPTLYYICSTGSANSSVKSFAVAQQVDSFSVAIFGDMGIEGSEPTKARVQRWVEEGEVQFVYHVGDMSYADDRLRIPIVGPHLYQEVFNDWFVEVENITAAVPYLVTCGNHEWPYNFTFFKERFLMPNYRASQNMWYSFDYANTHFIALTYMMPYKAGTPQLAWFEADLAAAAAAHYD